MALRGGDRAIDRALELGPVGKAGQVIGARLPRVLAGAVEGDSDLVGDSGHERQVARLESSRQAGRHRHGAQEHAFGPQLGADRAPLAGDAVDARLGRAGRNLDHAHPPSRASRLELFFLAGL